MALADSESHAVDTPSFPPGVTENLGYYVYALQDPRDGGEIFYVGKGKGNRVYRHARRAQRIGDESEQTLRLSRIREIHAAGHEVGIDLIRRGLTEPEAFTVEAAVIDALKLAGLDLANLAGGQGAGQAWEPFDDIIARYSAEPMDLGDIDVVLIRLNRERWLDPEHDLLEKTRKWWRLGTRRLEADWAFTVYQGIVRAVFRIEGWEQPTARDLEGKPHRVGRWAFRGSRDPEMEAKFLYCDVRQYLGSAGAQNPVKYVNC